MSISATSRVSATTPHLMRRAGDIVVEKADGIASVALTRTEPVMRDAPVSSGVARPDPFFITQLIATAEQAPQTRALRRAGIADVEAAYRAVAEVNAAGSATNRMQRMV